MNIKQLRRNIKILQRALNDRDNLPYEVSLCVIHAQLTEMLALTNHLINVAGDNAAADQGWITPEVRHD